MTADLMIISSLTHHSCFFSPISIVTCPHLPSHQPLEWMCKPQGRRSHLPIIQWTLRWPALSRCDDSHEKNLNQFLIKLLRVVLSIYYSSLVPKPFQNQSPPLNHVGILPAVAVETAPAQFQRYPRWMGATFWWRIESRGIHIASYNQNQIFISFIQKNLCLKGPNADNVKASELWLFSSCLMFFRRKKSNHLNSFSNTC